MSRHINDPLETSSDASDKETSDEKTIALIKF